MIVGQWETSAFVSTSSARRSVVAWRVHPVLAVRNQQHPAHDLSWIVERALTVAEARCFDALAAEDADAFRDRCHLAAALYDFGICSNLLAGHRADRRHSEHQEAASADDIAERTGRPARRAAVRG